MRQRYDSHKRTVGVFFNGLWDARRLVGGEAGVILRWLVRDHLPSRSPNANQQLSQGQRDRAITTSCCNPISEGVGAS